MKISPEAIVLTEGTEIDCTNGTLQLPCVPGASLPADPPDGQIVWDTTALALKVSADGVWLPLAFII